MNLGAKLIPFIENEELASSFQRRSPGWLCTEYEIRPSWDLFERHEALKRILQRQIDETEIMEKERAWTERIRLKLTTMKREV